MYIDLDHGLWLLISAPFLSQDLLLLIAHTLTTTADSAATAYFIVVLCFATDVRKPLLLDESWII